jgi:DNA ligase D-like protein (predicted 3'-phosphoesterase)
LGYRDEVPRKELTEYERKRHRRRTPEPFAGKRGRGRRGKQAPRFVVQKHDASSLHYDFRLEAGGVLKSWAVPKGPSLDPRDKRLAMPTEDHPLEYGGFEGTIPEGEYGGGSVIVWDTGTYRDLTDSGSVEDALDNGHLKFWLDGEKLSGGFALTRIGKGSRWLLVKIDDEGADRRRKPVKSQPESVLTGRTVEEVAEEDE